MKPIIVLQTDFTYKEGAVAAMKGVIKTVDPSLEIIDLTHEIPQFDIWSASFRLHQVIHFWPQGTLFVTVVDPGVGSSRKACVALTHSGHIIVTPDNQTLTHVEKYIGFKEIIEIDPKYKYDSGFKSSIFHGRDIFGYVAALLASGQLKLKDVGQVYTDIQRFDLKDPYELKQEIFGIIEIVDPNFGNAWSNISYKYLELKGIHKGDQLKIEIHYEDTLYYQGTHTLGSNFSEVELYEASLYINELENLAIALNQASFIETYTIGYGLSWIIKLTKENHV